MNKQDSFSIVGRGHREFKVPGTKHAYHIIQAGEGWVVYKLQSTHLPQTTDEPLLLDGVKSSKNFRNAEVLTIQAIQADGYNWSF